MNLEKAMQDAEEVRADLESRQETIAQVAHLQKEAEGLRKQIAVLKGKAFTVNTIAEDAGTRDEERERYRAEAKEADQKRAELEKELASVEARLAEYDGIADTSKNYSKQICFSNIRLLLKQHPEVKLGQIEKDGGCQPGYMSRLEKPNSSGEPTVAFVVSAAKAFGISLNTLLYVDLSKLNSTEEYLANFLQKMIEKTEGLEYIWEKVSASRLRDYDHEHDPDNYNPMFELRDVDYGIDGSTGYPDVQRVAVYNSLFHPGESVGLLGDAYIADLGGNREFYLIPVGVDDTDEEPPHLEYELYLVKRSWDVSKVCHTSYKNESALDSLMEDLYTAAEVSSHVPIIGDDVKDVIDEILTDLPF